MISGTFAVLLRGRRTQVADGSPQPAHRALGAHGYTQVEGVLPVHVCVYM